LSIDNKQALVYTDDMAVYNRLAVFRVEQGLSRKDVAEAVGVNPQTVGYLERGDYAPSIELVLKLARLFGVSVETLFRLEPFEPLSQQLAAKEGA